METREHLLERAGKNKRNSIICIFLVIVLLTICGGIIGAALAPGVETAPLFATGIALIVSGIMSMISYYYGDRIILFSMGAKEANPDNFHGVWKERVKMLNNVVDEMAIASGLPRPKVYVIESAASNAFATGRDPQHSSVAVTTGILEILDRNELQAVIGHEMSHIKHLDILYGTLMATLVGAICLLADAFWRFLRVRGRGRGKASQADLIIFLVAIILAILAPIVAQIIQLFLSRQREYLADLGGAHTTRNPLALASALEKIAGDPDKLDVKNRGAKHLFISDPDLKAVSGTSALPMKGSIFDTHPPIGMRVKILKELAGSGNFQGELRV